MLCFDGIIWASGLFQVSQSKGNELNCILGIGNTHSRENVETGRIHDWSSVEVRLHFGGVTLGNCALEVSADVDRDSDDVLAKCVRFSLMSGAKGNPDSLALRCAASRFPGKMNQVRI